MTRTWTIPLGWSRPPLSDNDRLHHMALHRLKARIRRSVAWRIGAARVPELDRCAVWLVYVPRDSRRRDTDNLNLPRKVAADAVVDAGVVPDDTPQYMSKPECEIWPADPRNPRVLLMIREEP